MTVGGGAARGPAGPSGGAPAWPGARVSRTTPGRSAWTSIALVLLGIQVGCLGWVVVAWTAHWMSGHMPFDYRTEPIAPMVVVPAAVVACAVALGLGACGAAACSIRPLRDVLSARRARRLAQRRAAAASWGRPAPAPTVLGAPQPPARRWPVTGRRDPLVVAALAGLAGIGILVVLSVVVLVEGTHGASSGVLWTGAGGLVVAVLDAGVFILGLLAASGPVKGAPNA